MRRTTARPTRHSATFSAWGSTATVTVDDARHLGTATRLAAHHLAAVARACDRRSATAEVHRLPAADGAPLDVSPVLARALAAALDTAAGTDGLVDPTCPAPRHDERAFWARGHQVAARRRRRRQDVETHGTRVRVPGGTALDLAATAVPLALDDAALAVAQAHRVRRRRAAARLHRPGRRRRHRRRGGRGGR
ncbi:hypothetical protein GCM10025868_13780 [Angustibacter aerolatus]|uniref:FAD:protein FMN transferase n=1 Tax=Angustibacter aerolatus TaxID=1162965 RepID=A0ABQ6JDA7_9ACTN|nr:FAD:protein FMN transferase [Angustibacter aerolatus]GMA86128.1 hypothetical protein GCM10025868_13780 [Angustibacter aerolatus]